MSLKISSDPVSLLGTLGEKLARSQIALRGVNPEAENLQIYLTTELNELQDLVAKLKVKSKKIPKVGWYTSATGAASQTTALIDNIDTKLIELSEKYAAVPIKSYKK